MTLPNRTIDVIADELQVALKRETVLTIGGLLAEAKDKITHGEWLPWLKTEFSMSERSAYAAKYELGADLKLSPAALFLLSRYDQREIADAVTEAAKQNHVGCDQVKKIVQDVIDRAKSKAGGTNGAPQNGGARSRTNSRDELVFSFTAAFMGLHRLTKSREAARFTKSEVKADDLAQLGQLLTELANLKAEHAVLEVSIDPVARQGMFETDHVDAEAAACRAKEAAIRLPQSTGAT
jgi:hypothetical protein